MKKTYIGISIIAIAALVVVVMINNGTEEGVTGAVVANQQNPPLSIGMQTGPASTLLMVAKDKGFFEGEGVDVELVEFTAGKFALQAFLAGSIDLAASGEVPVMYSAFSENEFYVVTQLVAETKNEVRVVALKEEGLEDPTNFFSSKKRKLATSFGGGPEFYTYNFLKKYGIEDVELISQKPEDMPAALASGSVDAIAIFEPFAYFAENKLGDKAITFKDGDLYSELYVLDAKRDWVASNEDTLKKLFRALIRASDFIEENPEESKEVLMKYTKLDKETVDAIWDNFVYKPALNDLLVEYLNAEAVWVIETGKVDSDAELPDFSEYIHTDTLEAVDPSLVTI